MIFCGFVTNLIIFMYIDLKKIHKFSLQDKYDVALAQEALPRPEFMKFTILIDPSSALFHAQIV